MANVLANPTSLLFTSASSQYISIADNAAFHLTGSFTIEAQIKTSTTGAERTIFQTLSVNPNIAGLRFEENASVPGGVNILLGRNTGSTSGVDYIQISSTKTISDGHWHHVAATYDGTSISIYIDGILDTNSAWTYGAGYAATNYVQIAGENQSGTTASFFNGNINNVRVWNIARTQSQIADRVADVTGSTGLVAWWRFKDTAGTTLTDVVGGYNGTLVNSPTWSTDVPFTVHESTVNSNEAALGRLFTDANLVSLYKLEDTSDSKGTNTLTNNGGATFTSGKYNNAVNFGSANTTKTLSTTSNLSITGGACTIAIWVNVTTAPSTGTAVGIVGQEDPTTTFIGQRIFYSNNAGVMQVGFRRTKFGVANNGPLVNYTLTPGTWYHLVYVYDGTYVRGYINGVSVGTPVADSGNGSGTTGDTNKFTIGNTPDNYGYFSGLVDDTLVFSRPLSDADVMDLYIGKKVAPMALGSTGSLGTDANLKGYWKFDNNHNDSSTDGYTLTPTGSPTFGAGKFGQDLVLNGTNYDSITATNSPNLPRTVLSDFSFSFWIYPNATPNAQVGILGYPNTGTDFVATYFAGTTQQISFVNNGNGQPNRVVTSTVILQANQWYYVTVVNAYSQSLMKLYVNGTLTMATSSLAAGTNTGDFQVGAIAGIGDTNSNFDDVAVFNRALTDDEMATLFYGVSSMSSAGLLLMGVGA